MSNVWQAMKEVKHLVIVLLCFVGSFCFAMFQGGFTSWFILFTITPFVLYAVLLQIVPLSFRHVVRDITPTTLTTGDAVTITVTVERSNRFPLCFVALEDDVQHAYTMKRRQLQLVGFRKTLSWSLTHADLARGEYKFDALRITCYDFFHWSKRTFTVDAAQSFFVRPRVQTIRPAAIETQMERGATASRYAALKDTSMVTSVRNYQPGDRMSWIHWKSFAKTEQLRTKDFEDKQSQHVLLMLDLQQGAMFEEAISLAASLLTTFARQQSEAVFMTVGQTCRVFQSVQTVAQMNDVMHHLASVQPEQLGEQKQFVERATKQAGAFLYVTADLSEERIHMLKQLRKQIVCLVVSDVPQPRQLVQNLHILYVPHASFEFVLKEVAKR